MGVFERKLKSFPKTNLSNKIPYYHIKMYCRYIYEGVILCLLYKLQMNLHIIVIHTINPVYNKNLTKIPNPMKNRKNTVF